MKRAQIETDTKWGHKTSTMESKIKKKPIKINF